MKICHCNWFNKEADGPIAEQDKYRQQSQIENDGREGGVWGVARRCREEQDGQAVLGELTRPNGKV